VKAGILEKGFHFVKGEFDENKNITEPLFA
jgi:hypothetical protein